MWAWIGLIVGWIWTGIQATYDVLVTALLWAFRAAKAFGLLAWDAGKFVWSNIVKPVFEILKAYAKILKDFYTNYVKPLQDWLKRISKMLRTIYDTYFKPVLDVIDAARKTLQLLELLHVEWAKALDQYLLKLEQKIAAPILEAIQFVNALDSRIDNYVLTIEHLFQRVTLLKTIERDVKPLLNIQWATMLRGLSQAVSGPRTGAPDAKSADEWHAQFEEWLDADGATGEPLIDDAVAQFEDALST
jgi:hypothetical protein